MKVTAVMGSSSGWKIMQENCAMLEQLEMPYEKKVVSAHRTSKLMFDFASGACANGYDVTIAGAGGAAHLPEMVVLMITLPIIGVPTESKGLEGLDSLLSIVQMPGGTPVAATAIGKPGVKSVGILATRILSIGNDSVRKYLEQYKQSLADRVGEMQDEL